MNDKNNCRPNRPLPNNYNKINQHDMNVRPIRERKRRRINYTRILCFICVILLAILIVCFYYLFQKEPRSGVSAQNKYCAKKDCVISAASILKSMDRSFYPCDDFFQYSCGNSIDFDQKNKNNLMNPIKYILRRDLKNSIESFSDEKQPKYIRKVYKYYKSCLNEAQIEKLDLKPLKEIVEELGGWPVVEGQQWLFKTKHYHWINTYIMMRKIGVNANSLFKLDIERDVRNSSRFIARIDRPEFHLNPQRLNDSEAYFDFMVKIAEMMGADRVDAQNDLLRSLIFEKELINLTLSEGEHQNNTYLSDNYMKVRQMQIFAPNINWIQYLTEFIGRPVNEEMELIVMVPSYIRKLNQKLIQTESRVLADYLIWKVIYQTIPLISKRWREPMEKYFLNSVENYQKENRWQTCLKQTQNLMPFQLANIYMKKHFNKRNEIEVISMINNIKESFIEILDKNKWMSDEVRAKAKEKILLMELRIGFPKELLDENRMDSWLRDIQIEKEYFRNTLKLNLFLFDEKMKNLYNSDDNPKLLWEKFVNPADIILKYRPEDNALLISAALINGFYREEVPKYLNYGSLGLLISRQMINVCNEIGRLYNGEGIQSKWWDRQTETTFDNYKHCYGKQIEDSEDVLKEMSQRDRIKFIDQLIADKSAVEQTILAYRSYVKQFGPELVLVGINHTSEQLFWIKSAKTYLTYSSDNQIRNNYERNKYRINSILSNVKEFSDAFNCTLKSSMNRPIECYKLNIGHLLAEFISTKNNEIDEFVNKFGKFRSNN